MHPMTRSCRRCLPGCHASCTMASSSRIAATSRRRDGETLHRVYIARLPKREPGATVARDASDEQRARIGVLLARAIPARQAHGRVRGSPGASGRILEVRMHLRTSSRIVRDRATCRIATAAISAGRTMCKSSAVHGTGRVASTRPGRMVFDVMTIGHRIWSATRRRAGDLSPDTASRPNDVASDHARFRRMTAGIAVAIAPMIDDADAGRRSVLQQPAS